MWLDGRHDNIHWDPLGAGWVKLNVDGAFSTEDGVAGLVDSLLLSQLI